MFTLVKRKLQNKKCLNGCLLLGIVLFISIMACTPMFKRGSLDKLLQSKFISYIEENNEYPTVLSRSGSLKTKDSKTMKAIEEEINNYGAAWQEYMEIPENTVENHIWIKGSEIIQEYGGKNNWPDIACIPNLEDHIEILDGEIYKWENDKKKDIIYPCLITRKVMDDFSLVTGETIEFKDIKDKNGKPLKMQVTGIFEEKNNKDVFWHVEANEFEKQVFVNENVMEDIISNFSTEDVFYDYYMLLDYTEIHSKNVADVEYYLNQFHELDESFTDNFTELLRDYEADKSSVNTIFWVLELPVSLLLLAFVYMVAGQILDMESGEIAMLKSRGFSRKHIIYIYICQSGVLAGIGMIIGVPLGYLICKLAASTDAFLKFSVKSTQLYKFTPEMLLYALIAGIITMAFMTLPVFGYSKYSIVEQKSKKSKMHNKGVIEKYFLDIILFVVSCYLLFNYNKQKGLLATSVMTGEKLDPFIFLNAFFFLLACGLVGLRLINYLVKFIYYIGKDKWKPDMYASFLQIMRTAGKQRFISVFLVITIAMGIFNSNMAGTINTNNEERLKYNVGADVVTEENWNIKIIPIDQETIEWLYEEPDYGRYDKLEDGICKSITRVVRDDNVKVSTAKKSLRGCQMMAIHSKEFGETVELKEGLNDTHWYHYLNELAKNASGILISKNMAEEFNLKVGDNLRYERYSPVIYQKDKEIASCSGIVCGIFEAWPGYEEYQYGYDEDGKWKETENYMIVANYAYEVNTFGTMPYQVWMNLDKGSNAEDVRNVLAEQNMDMKEIIGTAEEIKEKQDSAMIQITNGLFTLSFMVSIILCTVGFLIYWITSIKQRELLFGIYRAMGMSMKEVNKMLINEQIFSSFFAGIIGGIAGFGTTLLFAKIVAIVYLPQSHNIPLETVVDVADMCKLGIIVLLMIGVCLAVLRYILKNSSITQAIKMGED